MKELTYLLIMICIYFVYTNFVRKKLFLVKVKGKNGVSYLVRNLKDKQEAANILGELSDNLQDLCDACVDKETSGDRKEAVERLSKKFKSREITENIPGSQHVAYSVNKGEELSICIRKKDSEEFMDKNTIRFVAIHELAHIMSESSGHTPEFWDNMKYLLEQAIANGIYKAVDYSKSPVDYCGMKITDTFIYVIVITGII